MKTKNRDRRGITLIELLVVIAIMMILTAIVLPRLNLGSEGQKTREAARIVSTYLAVARNKAIETGRPCGVLFEQDGTSQASLQMIQVQEPAPYAGDSTDCKAVVAGLSAILDGTQIQLDLIRLHDKIQFDHKGLWYEIIGPDIVNNTTNDPVPDGILDAPTDVNGDSIPDRTVTLAAPSGYPIPPGGTLSFQIRRQPVSTSGSGQTIRTMTPPQRLPLGTAVDLTASGFGSHFFGGGSVAIMFRPNGSVQSVSGASTTDPIYLLVGKASQVPGMTGVDWYTDPNIPDNDAQPNWQHPESRWVVVSPSTGISTVAQNTVAMNGSSPWVPDGSPDDGINPTGTEDDMRVEVRAEAIPAARAIAAEGLDGGDRR